MTAKSAPYPPCTVTAFWLKYQDPARMRRRVTQPPHIAGPLYVRFRITMISNAQARVWQLATATAFAAAKHMHFCQAGIRQQDN
jgi:hypothetical protein